MILHTRPIHDHDQMILDMEQRDIPFYHAPLFHYIYCDMPEISWDAPILITSKFCVNVLKELQFSGKITFDHAIFCVGFETERALKTLNFKNIKAPPHGEFGVLCMMEILKSNKKIIYLRGDITKHNICELLAPDTYVLDIICYKTIPNPPPNLDGITAVTFFSQKTYDTFLDGISHNAAFQNMYALCYLENFTQKHRIVWKNVITASTTHDLIDKFIKESYKNR